MDKRGDKRSDKRRHNRSHELGTLQDAQRQKKRDRHEQPKQKTGSETRCECGGIMKARGPVGHAGHLRWKCRKCGRTVWVRPDFTPPVPIVPVSKVKNLGG